MLSADSLSARAEPLLNLFIECVTNQFKERVISTFKFGSLGSHGDFSLCSDVDVVLMLDQVKDSDHKIVQKLWDDLKSTDLEYADRLSVFWSSYDKATFENGVGRFPPLDRLDLIRYGILMTGTDRRAELPEPNHQELILASAEFIISFMLAGDKLDKLTQHPEKIIAEGTRYLTKFVLFPVRLIFTLDNPGLIGSNKDAVEYFNSTLATKIPEAVEVINTAYALRNTPPDSIANMDSEKLQTALLLLYAYCINKYEEAASELKQTDLANELHEKKKIICSI